MIGLSVHGSFLIIESNMYESYGDQHIHVYDPDYNRIGRFRGYTREDVIKIIDQAFTPENHSRIRRIETINKELSELYSRVESCKEEVRKLHVEIGGELVLGIYGNFKKHFQDTKVPEQNYIFESGGCQLLQNSDEDK